MRHPLVNPSLTPFGFVGPLYRQRLDYKPPSGGNRERIIAKLWATWNREGVKEQLPAELIIHEQLPSMSPRLRCERGEFIYAGKPYNGSDIATISAAVQWLGTNVGDCFLFDHGILDPELHPERVFRAKFRAERWADLLTHRFAHHMCTGACTKKYVSPLAGYSNGLDADRHEYVPIGERDRALVDSVMWWLGRSQGRAFAAEYKEKRDRAYKAAEDRFRAQYSKHSVFTGVSRNESSHMLN